MLRIKRRNTLLFLSVLLGLILLFGAAQAEGAKISGVIWVDKNIDGLMKGENVLSGSVITLEKQQEDGSFQSLSSFNTDKTGGYTFESVPDGAYRLIFELPKGYQFTLHGLDSSALPAQGGTSSTPVFTVSGKNVSMNAGATKAGSYVDVIAFEDENENGGRMSSEELVRSIPVSLVYDFEGESYVIASGVTDKNGECVLRDLSPATYRLCATLPENFVSGPLGQKITSFHNCLLPSDGAEAFTAPFELKGKSSAGLGLGLVRTGSVQGKVWFDENSNGVWDNEEAGMTEATVILTSKALSTHREIHPEKDGSYSFTRLQPGTYQLVIELPEHMLFADGKGSLLHAISSRDQVNVSVQADRTTKVENIGASHAASLTVEIANDENASGERDENEKGLTDVQAVLYQNGKEVAQAISDENGVLSFPVVRVGEASVQFVLPEGFLFTDENQYAQSSYEAAWTVREEDEENRYLLHAAQSCTVSGFVFDDPENKGVYQAEFSALTGFTVQAVDADGVIRAEEETNENGEYCLQGLLPGVYTVRFLLGDSYIASPYTEGAEISNHILSQTPDYGETAVFPLEAGEAIKHVDGAVFKAGIIDGTVLSNVAHDGLETNEGGVRGVTVTLLDENALPVADYTYDVTDENGSFTIKGVLPGNYALLYELPDELSFIDRDEKTLDTAYFTVTGGSLVHADPVAAVRLGAVTGTVRCFAPDATLPQPVTIRLTNSFYGEQFETETDAAGAYSFVGLRPDDYVMQFILPQGFAFAAVSDSAVPASLDQNGGIIFTLSDAETKADTDIVTDMPASLSGFAFFDDDMDGIFGETEEASEGRRITLERNGEEIRTVTANSEGSFLLQDLIPGEYEVRVYLDSNEIIVDEENWENGVSFPISVYEGCDTVNIPLLAYAAVSGNVWNLDGSDQDISGIAVSLCTENGDIMDTMNTDSKGQYRFDGLLPGTYLLKAELPDGYLFAREQDSESRSSFIQSNASGKAIQLPIEVLMGENCADTDIGMGAMGSIGDHAWLDENGNGMQDIGEKDMPGIQIEMYQYGELVASTATDGFGRYEFRNLYPGVYDMKVTMHAELKATKKQTEFPLVASVLPEEDGLTLTAQVTVPSGGENLHCDLGFVLRKAKVYPDAMKDIPVKDWTPYAER